MMSAYVSCRKETEKNRYAWRSHSCTCGKLQRASHVAALLTLKANSFANHNMMEIMISNVVLSVFSATNKQAGNWSRNAFRDCFWDCYRRCACQLSANFSPRSCCCLRTTSKLEKTLNIYNCSKWPLFVYCTHLQKTS